MEKISVDALNSLEGELKGKYYSLETMTPEENQQLIDDHFMFKNDDRYIVHNPSEIRRDWKKYLSFSSSRRSRVKDGQILGLKKLRSCQ